MAKLLKIWQTKPKIIKKMMKSRYFIVFLPREVNQTVRQLDDLGHHRYQLDAYGNHSYPYCSAVHWI
jgi:hypothetical protein